MSSASKVTALMEILCASAPLSLREIEERTGIPRSTVHRILLSLEVAGWVFHDTERDGYRPGIRFFLLSNRSSLYDELIRTAHPVMGSLMEHSGNTSVLSVLEGASGFCIHSVEPSSSVKFTAHRGMAIPLHAGATGKILLAHSSPEIRSRVLSSPLPSPLGEGEIDRVVLEKELELIRKQGYASSREEWIAHAGDISVPLFDGRGQFVAQLGMAGIAEKVFGNFDGNLRLLKSAAEAVEQRFEKTMEVV